MSLIRYTHPMMGMQQHINRMFDQFDTELFGRLEGLGEGMFAPAVDVKEDADAYTVHLEVPGVAQDDLHLSLQDNVLTIRGSKEQQEESEGRYRRVERSYGSFARTLSLPRNVDASSVAANLEDGVLEVRLPKREESKPRQINVGTTRDAAVENAISDGAQAANAQAANAQTNGTQSDAQNGDGTQVTGSEAESALAGNPS